jgi:tetratricopeptide (TPR) repeat protein
MTEALRELIDEGLQAYERGAYVEAEQLLTRALREGAERYADVHHSLGVIFHGSGRFADARAAFEKAVAINPDYTEAAINLAITYNDLGHYDEAQSLMARLKPQPGPVGPRTLDPFIRGKIANLHAKVADAYRSAGALGDACREYAKALELGPDFVDIRMRLALTLADRGATDDAIRQLRLIVDARPGFANGWVQLGLLLSRTDDPAGARAALNQALERDPEHPRALAYLRMLEH